MAARRDFHQQESSLKRLDRKVDVRVDIAVFLGNRKSCSSGKEVVEMLVEEVEEIVKEAVAEAVVAELEVGTGKEVM